MNRDNDNHQHDNRNQRNQINSVQLPQMVETVNQDQKTTTIELNYISQPTTYQSNQPYVMPPPYIPQYVPNNVQMYHPPHNPGYLPQSPPVYIQHNDINLNEIVLDDDNDHHCYECKGIIKNVDSSNFCPNCGINIKCKTCGLLIQSGTGLCINNCDIK